LRHAACSSLPLKPCSKGSHRFGGPRKRPLWEDRKISHALNTGTTDRPAASQFSIVSVRPAQQAYFILYAGFVALPILAGADKFLHLLVNWDQYLAPLVTQILPVSAHTFMLIVGVIEITAGILVALRPRIGACVVALWLWGIIVNLLLIPGFYDIALRDFGLSLGALALARLSQEFARPASLQ